MRFGKLMLTLLGFAAVLCAADPYVGTWKLNVAKSKATKGEPPKDQTLVITENGPEITVKVSGTASDGSKMDFAYVLPAKGGIGKFLGKAPYDEVSGKTISSRQRELTYVKGGKTVYTSHSKVSADGKTLTADVKGTNSIGKPIEGTAVFERQ